MKKGMIAIIITALAASAALAAAPPAVAAPLSSVAPGAYAEATVAVLPFVNNSSANRLDYLGPAVAKMLVTDLKRSATLKVVTRDNLDDVLAELKLDHSALADPANAQKIGKLLGADVIVTGSILAIGTSLRFDAHVIDVATAEVVAGQKVEGAGENETLKMVDTLAMALIRDITGETIAINSTDPYGLNYSPAHQGDVLTFWPVLGNEYALMGSAATAYLELKFRAADLPTDVKRDRPPLNLCLVIDRSGSMGDAGKLDYVKEAAYYVIDSLGPKDRISVVAFDSDVKTVQGNTGVEDKRLLKSRIDELFPGSNTNISGGLKEGYNQANKWHKKNYVNRLILLSDGLANEGITDLEKLSSIAREWESKGVYTTAMGVGNDYNDQLLRLIATGGAGNYYYIDKPATLPGIFARELTGLINIAAGGITVDLNLEPGVTLAKVNGYQYRDLGGGHYEISVGDIAGGQEYTVFCQLSLPMVNEEKTVTLGNVAVRYTDPNKKTAVASTPTNLAMRFIPQPEVVAANYKPEVVNTVYLMENAEVMEQARDLVSSGKRGEAEELLKKQKDLSRTRAATSPAPSQELLDNANALEDLENQAKDDESSDAEVMKAAGAEAIETQYH